MNTTSKRWSNQDEAVAFAMAHPAVMLDMDMGTGKTRVAIDTVFEREDTRRVLVVCPKAVIPVWRVNLQKFHPGEPWVVADFTSGTVTQKSERIVEALLRVETGSKIFVVVNYDIVWRQPLGNILLGLGFDTVILDESHRAKAAGSKVSKYLAMLGKRVKYRMCLSGTPMANSPLDVYGQYRFLDPSIFGANHSRFLGEYAILGGPEHNFIVGYKNQAQLQARFQSIAYTCKMSDVAARLKLPPVIPDNVRLVDLPARDMAISKKFGQEFIAACGDGHITANNILTQMLRLRQIAAGFCQVSEGPLDEPEEREMNTAKIDALADMLEDISPRASVVLFCVFRHDLDQIALCAEKAKRSTFELSGRHNQLEEWKKTPGSILAVQIQAGAEGVDMTCANHAIYYTLPYSLAQYEQSRARLYRPGQTNSVVFTHILARGTIDEAIYQSLVRKKDVIESVKNGSFDFGYLK